MDSKKVGYNILIQNYERLVMTAQINLNDVNNLILLKLMSYILIYHLLKRIAYPS